MTLDSKKKQLLGCTFLVMNFGLDDVLQESA